MKFIDELIVEAMSKTFDRCGSCSKWLKTNECPKENGIGSKKGGPSANELACDEYEANK